ncbi:MAG: S8 family peptidase [candidate division Zixibacteria bacterium]|nr:S8 family peptidase [candidate division Zixibacteria bacterium]
MVSGNIFILFKKSKLLFFLFFLSLLILPRRIVPEEIPGEKIILEYPVENPKVDFRTRNLLNKLPSDSAIAVWVFFTDKGIKTDGQYRKALQECSYQLSERSIERRKRRGKKPIFDFTDIPVKKEYVDELRSFDVKIRVVSKWLNAASVMANKNQIEEIEKLRFVRAIKKVATFYRKEPPPPEDHLKKIYEAPKDQVLRYGESYAQLAQINVPALHNLGYSGDSVLITMLDTGYFIHHRAFEHILNEGRLIATWDFINDDEDVEDGPEDQQRDHGTYTLSAVGGFVEDTLIGPAYGAQFALAKTEVRTSETQIEEDHWIAGVEWADSLGTDIVSSSLGYLDWYTYADMDGNTALCTIAADSAVSKGIVVVNSAGNKRDDPWYYIIAPADGDSVIAVGAVNLEGELASFSSAGPTYDGRIKPDVVACGVQTYCAWANGGYGGVNGTSLSTPLVAGVCALLLEIHPDWTPIQVREALWTTASQADQPDNLMGYGIVNASRASGLNFLVFSPGEFEFETTLGDTHSQVDTLVITSTVSESLEWKLIQRPDWVRVEPDSGVTPCTCKVSIDPARLSHLKVGIHRDTIKVSPKDAINWPQSVAVTLIIRSTAKIVTFPNPFSDSLTVVVDKSNASDKIKLSIFTVAGELVYQFSEEDRGEVFQKTWDGRNDRGRRVSSGVYLLKVDINGHSEIFKIAKIK